MANLICLKEIEPPIIFHSQLYFSTKIKSRYCVLAENHFIIFLKSSDVMSQFRIPLNKFTKINSKDKEFTITYYECSFTLSHQNMELINKWINYLNNAVKENVQEVMCEYHTEVVKIDKIKNMECSIMIGRHDYKLFIYDSYDYKKFGICRHLINLKYYQVNVQNSNEKSPLMIYIRSLYEEFKFTFNSEQVTLEWSNILKSSIVNYLSSLTDENILNEIYKNKSNRFCVDCNSPDPKWVSMNICVTLCDLCVGLHRELGTKVSRTQSTVLDEKCWKDSLLVRLIIEIGNENANDFWCKKASKDSLINIEKKYKTKDYIDDLYVGLNEEDIVEQLSNSVKTNNIVNTMRIWFSYKEYFKEETINTLLTIAKENHQELQEKFLNLQENISKAVTIKEDILISLEESVVNLSYNNSERSSSLFLLSIYQNRIEIKKYNPCITLQECGNICVIYFNYITILYCPSSDDSLQISFYPHYKFLNSDTKDFVDITSLEIFDNHFNFVHKLKIILLNILLSEENYEAPNIDTCLYFLTDIQLNKEGLFRCKSHIINHELILSTPINMKYNLTLMEELNVSDDKMMATIVMSFCDIYIHYVDNFQIILNCLNEASNFPLLSLNDEYLSEKLISTIEFIKFNGLDLEDIFQIDGKSEKINRLFLKVLERNNDFIIDPNQYTVHDVTSTLRKCLSNLAEPLIPIDFFQNIKSHETKDVTINLYKDALDVLYHSNKCILRLFIELLFIILKRSKCNKLNSEKLSQLTISYFISPKIVNKNVYFQEIQYLIENFIFLFDYSTIEQQILFKFLENLKNPLKMSINRTFYVDSSLINFFKTINFPYHEYTKLKSLLDFNACISCTCRIDEYETVSHLYSHIFHDLPSYTIDLWLFVYVKKKIFKRLLYLDENVESTIVNYRKFPHKFNNEKKLEILIFLPAYKNNKLSNTPGMWFQCIVKVNGVRRMLMLSMPNSLKFFHLESIDPMNDFKLTDINIYRAHAADSSTIYILFNVTDIIKCKFKKIIDYQEFLLYLDLFRMQSIENNK